MKIDAQGAEALIVKGAQNLLQTLSPKIFMEFEPEMLKNAGADPADLITTLRRYGYESSLIDYESLCLKQLGIEALIAECKRNGYVDLFLEKNPPNELGGEHTPLLESSQH